MLALERASSAKGGMTPAAMVQVPNLFFKLAGSRLLCGSEILGSGLPENGRKVLPCALVEQH